jgi:hypothetical protein
MKDIGIKSVPHIIYIKAWMDENERAVYKGANNEVEQ